MSDDIVSMSLKSDIREYRIKKSLKHSGLLDYYDLFTLNGKFFDRAYVVLVMQHIDGFTIGELYDSSTVVRGKVFLNLLKQFLGTISYLRSKNISQGDFDTTYVMVTKDFSKIYIINYEKFCYDIDRLTSNDDLDFMHCSKLYTTDYLAKMWNYKRIMAVLYGLARKDKDLKIVGTKTEFTKEVAMFVFKNTSAYNVREMIKYIDFGLAS